MTNHIPHTKNSKSVAATRIHKANASKSNITSTATLLSLFTLIAIDTMGVGLIWPLFGPLFMGQEAASLLPPHTSIFIRDVLYGITIGIFPTCMFFGAPILGDLSDHIGRKKVLIICLLGTCIGLSICTLGIIWRCVYLLILGRALLGALAGSQATAQAAIIDISAPEKKTISLGIITLATNLGFIAGPMLGGLLIDNRLVSWFTLTTPFVVAACLALCNAILLYFSFKETFFPKKVNQLSLTKGAQIFISAFINKKMRLAAIIYLCYQVSWGLSFQTSIIYLVQFYNYSGVQVGYFLAGVSAVFALSLQLIMRLVLRYFKIEKIICWSLGISAVSLIGATWHKELATWVFMLISTSGAAITYTGMLTILSDCATQEEQGWAMGVGGAVSAAGWSIGALFSGIAGAFHFPVGFLVASVFMALGWAGMLFKWRKCINA